MLSREYIAGFIDGDGHFLIGTHKTKSQKGVGFYIHLEQREDNAEILFEVQKTLGCGVVFKQSKQYARDKGMNQHDMYKYSCASRVDVQKVLEFFGDGDVFFVKREEYKLFKKAFEWYTSRHRHQIQITKEVFDKMVEFKEELQRFKQYNSDKIPKIDVPVLTTSQTKLN